jgi:hypothetical protein
VPVRLVKRCLLLGFRRIAYQSWVSAEGHNGLLSLALISCNRQPYSFNGNDVGDEHPSSATVTNVITSPARQPLVRLCLSRQVLVLVIGFAGDRS